MPKFCLAIKSVFVFIDALYTENIEQLENRKRTDIRTKSEVIKHHYRTLADCEGMLDQPGIGGQSIKTNCSFQELSAQRDVVSSLCVCTASVA